MIGLSRSSPWRTAGLRFGDLLVAIDSKPVTHPQELLFAIRDRARTTLQLEVVRDGARRTIDAQSSARDSDSRAPWSAAGFHCVSTEYVAFVKSWSTGVAKKSEYSLLPLARQARALNETLSVAAKEPNRFTLLLR